MSGVIANGKYWTTDCIRHPKRRQCVCCPNGVHIDVDFDTFYKTLTKMQLQRPAEQVVTKQYKHFRRKQDPTIDSLLGYRNKSQPTVDIDEIVYKNRDMPAKASPDVQVSLEQALHDFEETLLRSSTTDVHSPLVSPLLTNQFSSSLSLRSDAKSDSFYKFTNGDKYGSLEPIHSPPEMFRTSTESIRTESTRTSFDSKKVQTPELPEIFEIDGRQKETKDVGINCTAFTCDVETSCTPVLKYDIATNTAHVHLTDSSCMTEIQENTSFALSHIFNSAQKISTVGTQTYSRVTSLIIIEKRDQGIQTDVQSPLGNCKLRNIFDEKLYKRSVPTATDLCRYGPDLQPIIENRCLYSKYSQTKDVVVRDQVFCKKVGSQTDQEIKPKYRDTSVNTIRNKLVDASTGGSKSISEQDWCQRCRQMKSAIPNSTNQSVSKIPRPKSAQGNTHSNKKKMLMRQDTYVTIPSTELEKLKELRDSDYFNKSNTELNQNSVNNEFLSSELQQDKTFFQHISNRKINVPTKEMKAAMKVLNDSLEKPNFVKLRETSLRNAISIIQEEWFKVSSLSTANPFIVEDYLNSFEEVSTHLLDFVVNLKDGAGNTAIHYAVSHGNFDVVSILLNSQVCDINIVNDAGYTCIMLVSLAKIKSSTHCDIIRRLFAVADVNIKAKQHGQTTLMLAASHGKLDVVKLLLECGADANIQDDDGSTALMCAAEHGYLEIVNILAVHPDVDLMIKDNDGSTALTIAMEAGHREIGIALYTRQHFADLNHPAAREKRSRSANPILIEHRTRTTSLRLTPSSPVSPLPIV